MEPRTPIYILRASPLACCTYIHAYIYALVYSRCQNCRLHVIPHTVFIISQCDERKFCWQFCRCFSRPTRRLDDNALERVIFFFFFWKIHTLGGSRCFRYLRVLRSFMSDLSGRRNFNSDCTCAESRFHAFRGSVEALCGELTRAQPRRSSKLPLNAGAPLFVSVCVRHIFLEVFYELDEFNVLFLPPGSVSNS